MDKKLNEICENLVPTELTILWYNLKSYYTIKHTSIPYNLPPFLAVNMHYLEYVTKGHIAMHTGKAALNDCYSELTA